MTYFPYYEVLKITQPLCIADAKTMNTKIEDCQEIDWSIIPDHELL